MLIKNSEKHEHYFKIKENLWKCLSKRKKTTSLLKTGFLVTLNLKERQKNDDLKLFESWSEFKIIWRKLEFWKLKFWKLLENWGFENYLKSEVLKIIWKLNLKIGILKDYLKMEVFEN